MDWKTKIILGMVFIKNGCHEADNCDICPFVKQCDALTDGVEEFIPEIECPDHWISN